jgi:hypothetical protein
MLMMAVIGLGLEAQVLINVTDTYWPIMSVLILENQYPGHESGMLNTGPSHLCHSL